MLSEKSDFKIRGPQSWTTTKFLIAETQGFPLALKSHWPPQTQSPLTALCCTLLSPVYWVYWSWKDLSSTKSLGEGRSFMSLFFGCTDQECNPTAIKTTKLPNAFSSLQSFIMWEPNTVQERKGGTNFLPVSTLPREEPRYGGGRGGGVSLPNMVCKAPVRSDNLL